MRRYARSENKNVDDIIKRMKNSAMNLAYCNTISEIMGNEGLAARAYFDGLSQLVHEEFKFKGRSKRPPKDEFNSMLSLGY